MRLLGLVLALFSFACAHQQPGFVTSADAAPVAPTAPHETPGGWALAFLDIETTGLVPGWHEAIDVGIVMTDLEGAEMGALFVRVQPRHPERVAEGARRVNAFDPERWRDAGAVTPAEAAARIAAFRSRVAGERNVMLVAFNSWFDAAFLDHLFRASDRSWRELFHYFVLDIPSMAWAKGHRELTGGALAEALGLPDEPRVAEEHTGLTGARLNARIYRALAE